jgi:hypothetical protein
MRNLGKQKNSKLSLNKETLRALADADLAHVAGGISRYGSICNFSDPCQTIAISNCLACTSNTVSFF